MGKLVNTGLLHFSRNDETAEITINISHLPTGIYLLKIETETGIIAQKIVKY